MNENVLLTQRLEVGYQSSLFPPLDWQVKKGELWAIVGNNGSGKSTLIKTLLGLQKIKNGDIFWENQSIKSLKSYELSKKIAWVSTYLPSIDFLKVIDILKTGRSIYTNLVDNLTLVDFEIIDQTLAMMQMQDKKNMFFSQLSDGQKQKVMLMRAIIQDTSILILDEPTAHLDWKNRHFWFEWIHHWTKNTQKTVIIATHEWDLVQKYCHHLLLIDTKKTLITSPNSEDANVFFDTMM
ncbi:MAG: ABC transporter ATP-binding protein [Cytophagia bacterium]|nr:MAG: ABC transporter ATP-binding protein [Cytophagales bacterium]TAG43173.1 MAG: ABC transporter ATP-binding protein [Cytophagia bacterium]TAH28782.1 MAG: ABC transporter ATP-binding protein [Cytophagales bacterium]